MILFMLHVISNCICSIVQLPLTRSLPLSQNNSIIGSSLGGLSSDNNLAEQQAAAIPSTHWSAFVQRVTGRIPFSPHNKNGTERRIGNRDFWPASTAAQGWLWESYCSYNAAAIRSGSSQGSSVITMVVLVEERSTSMQVTVHIDNQSWQVNYPFNTENVARDT